MAGPGWARTLQPIAPKRFLAIFYAKTRPNFCLLSYWRIMGIFMGFWGSK